MILSILIGLPLVVLILLSFIRESKNAVFSYALVLVSLLQLVISLYLYRDFDFEFVGYQFSERYSWIDLAIGNSGLLKIQYLVGLDGTSLSMVILASVVFLVASISSFSISNRLKSYSLFFLLLNASVFGCFLATDFFLFFLFFEFMLLPMYFLIGIWGGERKEYAAMKFIIYTLVGSVLILVVMLIMGLSVHDPSYTDQKVFCFDFEVLSNPVNYIKGSVIDLFSGSQLFGINSRLFLFFLLFIGFGIKLPTVPFHTWLPDAHVEAPTAISVVLAGILLKVGGYAFIKIGLGFYYPEANAMAWVIALFGLISILYGAFNALAQTDLKKMIAYSSVSHMGFVFLGLAAFNPEGYSGAVFQMFSHGLLSSMLFLIVGVIYDRTHDRRIDNYRGLAKAMPLLTFTVIIAFFGSLGLPGLSGFIGEFFSLLGAFNSSLNTLYPSLAVIGIILSAAYFLWTIQRMFFGAFWANKDFAELLTDLNSREKIMLFGLSILVVWMGVWPATIFDLLKNDFQNLMINF